mmetsp:Transcript_56698/g.132512  ORF Transcript_56698/g.132512 Transcript_56698/m.132512 type:complete len:260 (+) Transcript_56698:1654-2433(+)
MGTSVHLLRSASAASGASLRTLATSTQVSRPAMEIEVLWLSSSMPPNRSKNAGMHCGHSPMKILRFLLVISASSLSLSSFNLPPLMPSDRGEGTDDCSWAWACAWASSMKLTPLLALMGSSSAISRSRRSSITASLPVWKATCIKDQPCQSTVAGALQSKRYSTTSRLPPQPSPWTAACKTSYRRWPPHCTGASNSARASSKYFTTSVKLRVAPMWIGCAVPSSPLSVVKVHSDRTAASLLSDLSIAAFTAPKLPVRAA